MTHNTPFIIEEPISVYREYFNPNLTHLFLDEVHLIQQWEKALRKLRDTGSYQIFITGSSAKMLRGELAASLTGRHLSYQILPLSYAEFLLFEGIQSGNKKDLILQEKLLLKKFDEFLKIGGFPEIVLSRHEMLLKEYFLDFIQRDILGRYEVRQKDLLEKLGGERAFNSA